jgi:uncharacterized protein YbaP (TraB family)
MKFLHRLAGLAALALLAAAVPGAAQIPLTPAQTPAAAPADDPDAVLVEELVVTARERGPAFWRVEAPGSVVHVLGVPSLAPKHMQWDQAGFLRRLQGANEIIVPARGLRVRLTSAPAALITYLRLKSSTPFEERLPPAERGRFVAARTGLGKPAGRYGTQNPLAAALLLLTDYREHWNLTDSDPSKLIRLLAEQAKVPVVAKTYNLTPLLGAVARLKGQAGMPCLEDALNLVETGPQPTLAATRAWAAGDVRGALGAERTYERCLAAAPGAADFDARVKADQTEQIIQALRRPGHSIAVVQLRPLLAQAGVLDRLRARGFTVHTPGEE